MNVKELVGKRALRTKGVEVTRNGFGFDKPYKDIDKSYMREPIRIHKVTDSHIVFTYCDDHPVSKDWNTKLRIATNEYIDDNWVDYDELINCDPTIKKQIIICL
jgi:hypothetical protein